TQSESAGLDAQKLSRLPVPRLLGGGGGERSSSRKRGWVKTEPDRRPARLLRALLVLIAAAQTAHYYPLLPATLATHFNGPGEPNGWFSKQAFLELSWGLFLLTLLLPYWATRLMARLPSIGNIPNREYWFSGERRQETLDFIRDRMGRFAGVTLAFLMGTFELVLRANLNPLGGFSASAQYGLLVAYLLFVLRWLFRFEAKFGEIAPQVKPPRS